jgi:hypothetical protein
MSCLEQYLEQYSVVAFLFILWFPPWYYFSAEVKEEVVSRFAMWGLESNILVCVMYQLNRLV